MALYFCIVLHTFYFEKCCDFEILARGDSRSSKLVSLDMVSPSRGPSGLVYLALQASTLPSCLEVLPHLLAPSLVRMEKLFLVV